MTPEACQRLCEKLQASANPAKLLEVTLKQIEYVRAKRADISQRIRDLNDDYNQRHESLERERNEIQAACPHWNTQRHTGPNSGDSFTECLDCGGTVG